MWECRGGVGRFYCAFICKLKRLPYAEYVSDCVVPGLIGKLSSPAVDHIMADFTIRLISAINLGN